MKLIDGYYAKDQYGTVYWHEELPKKGQSHWGSRKQCSQLLSCIQIDGPWEDSLHRVENGKITKVQIYSKDQKVLVSDDGEVWYRRYYSHYKNGVYYIFKYGGTSWSGEGNGVASFKYIKPAEEE